MTYIEKIETYLIYLAIFLLPLFVLPIFPNFLDTPKLILLSLTVTILIVLKAIRLIFDKELKFNLSVFDLPVAGFALAYLASAIFKTPNKLEAFFVPGIATLIISSSFLYFFINQIGEEKKKLIPAVLILSGVVFSIISLLAFTKILANISWLPAFIKLPGFTPAGAPLVASIFLASLIPLGAFLIIRGQGLVKKIFWATSLLIVLFSFGISAYQAFPKVSLLDFGTSWAISLESIKQSPILGIGPGNFISAFDRFRPVTYNSTPFWNLKFASARNFYLTVLSEAGLLAIVFLALIIFRLSQKVALSKENLPVYVSLISILIFMALFPASLAEIILFFIFLALVARTREISYRIAKPANIIIILVGFALIAFLAFWGAKATLAEATYMKALEAANSNKGKETYDLLIKAITLNPYVDRYHGSYAQVNLALAQVLAQNLPAGKAGKDLTDDDRKTIGQLIQQGIREGKAAAALNSQRSGNWLLLGQIYRAIMAFAQGSDQFAIQAYQQAIALDPINPNLRIELGGVYYAQGKFDEAIDAFKLATLAKGDLANAHYNLAAAYREKGEIERAIAEINIVLSLVDKNSNDYETAKAELDNLEKKKPASDTKASENLTSPTKSAPLVNPPLPLPTP